MVTDPTPTPPERLEGRGRIAEEAIDPKARLSDDPDEERPIPHLQREWMDSQIQIIKDSIWLGPGGGGQRREGIKLQGSWPHKNTYWIHPPNPGFQKDGSQFDPLIYCLRPLFVWVPEYIYPEVFPRGVPRCPTCNQDTRVISEGFNPHGPRTVYGVRNTYYVICKRYRCRACKKSFNGYSPDVLDNMAPDIADDFPAVLRHRAAVSTDVVFFLREQCAAGAGVAISRFREHLKAGYFDSYLRSVLKYMSTVQRARKAFLEGEGYQAHLQECFNPGTLERYKELLAKPALFPDFESKEYGGRLPSETLLRSVLAADLERREPFLDRRMQMIVPDIIKADASYKLASRIRIGTESQLPVLFTVFSDIHEVTAFSLLESESKEETEKVLGGLKQRYLNRGLAGPSLAYIDNCCQNKEVFLSTFESLRPSEAAPRPPRSQALLSLADVQLHVVEVDGSETSNAQVNQLCRGIQSGGGKVCGFDLEWSINTDGSRGPVSLIQLANRDRNSGAIAIFMFRVYKVALKKLRLPIELEAILQDATIAKAGRCVYQDGKKLVEDFKAEMKGMVELADLAFQKLVMPNRTASLATLTSTILGAELDKSQAIRLSNWDTEGELSGAQVNYAARDALASLRIFEDLIERRHILEVPRPAQGTLQAGARVVLLSRTEDRILGTGEITYVPSPDSTGRRHTTEHRFMDRSIRVTKKHLVVRVVTADSPKSGYYHFVALTLCVTTNPLTTISGQIGCPSCYAKGDEAIEQATWCFSNVRKAFP